MSTVREYGGLLSADQSVWYNSLMTGPNFEEALAMPIIVEAVYEDGVLKPVHPLPFQEHEKVRITIKPAVSHVRRSAGLIGWTGSQEDADFVALSPELDPQEDT
jgi:predicted DNA-binding antitoxin AbrB/MazE fold protein